MRWVRWEICLCHVAGALAEPGVDTVDALEDVAVETEFFVSFQGFKHWLFNVLCMIWEIQMMTNWVNVRIFWGVGHMYDTELVIEAGDSEWETCTGVELAWDVCNSEKKYAKLFYPS